MQDSGHLFDNAASRPPLPQEEETGLAPFSPHTQKWWARFRWERTGWIVLVAVFLASIPYVLYRTSRNPGSDFPLFYQSGQYLLQHGVRDPDSKFAFYLPSADVAIAAFAWLPFPLAVVAWYVLNAGSWVLLLTAIHRYLLPGYNSIVARQAVLGAGLLMLPLVIDHLCVGAFHMLMVWLMVAGLGRVAQGRAWSGGAMLGLAVWVKLLPLMGVGYLVLKRKWLPAAVAMATLLVVDAALSLTAFGPAATWDLHCQWWKSEAHGRRNLMLTESQRIDEDRLTNQSVTIMVRRLLSEMGCGVSPARDAVAIGDLTPEQLKAVYMAIVGVLGLGVLVFCRRSGRDLTPEQWASEISLIVLSTLWFSPLVWSYHPTAATPALAILVARSPKHTRLVWAVAALWLLSQILLAWPVARAAGVLLWANLLVGAVLVWTSRRATPSAPSETEPRTGEHVTPPAQRRPLGNRQSVPA